MPFGMTPGAAAGEAHHSAATGMSMGHSPEGMQGHDGKAGLATCSMACAPAYRGRDPIGTMAFVRVKLD